MKAYALHPVNMRTKLDSGPSGPTTDELEDLIQYHLMQDVPSVRLRVSVSPTQLAHS